MIESDFFLVFVPQIYTDWANYYLERAKSKKKVSDLSADCRDGLLLAEVIEAVTAFKVPDLVKKPKTPQHMVSPLIKNPNQTNCSPIYHPALINCDRVVIVNQPARL